jgi:hypothetical protein
MAINLNPRRGKYSVQKLEIRIGYEGTEIIKADGENHEIWMPNQIIIQCKTPDDKDTWVDIEDVVGAYELKLKRDWHKGTYNEPNN